MYRQGLKRIALVQIFFWIPFPEFASLESEVRYGTDSKTKWFLVVHPRYASGAIHVDDHLLYFASLRVNERSTDGVNSRPAR